MPPRQKAKPAESDRPTEYKVGDIAPVKPGELVRRPDGVVVTSGGGHALNVPGEYVIFATNGDQITLTVTEVSTK